MKHFGSANARTYFLCSAIFNAVFAQNEAIPNDDEIVGWMEGPKGRGTTQIIVSCAITLFFCAWTALHPNIEPIEVRINGLESDSKLLGMVTWALITLIAPEMTLSIALQQFLVSLNLCYVLTSFM